MQWWSMKNIYHNRLSHNYIIEAFQLLLSVIRIKLSRCVYTCYRKTAHYIIDTLELCNSNLTDMHVSLGLHFTIIIYIPSIPLLRWACFALVLHGLTNNSNSIPTGASSKKAIHHIYSITATPPPVENSATLEWMPHNANLYRHCIYKPFYTHVHIWPGSFQQHYASQAASLPTLIHEDTNAPSTCTCNYQGVHILSQEYRYNFCNDVKL